MSNKSKQEKLAEASGGNFNTYLDRMAASVHFSTKQNIPPIIASWGCKRVLDVGCADGSFTNEIAKAVGANDVVGIDINPKCIEAATKKFPDILFVESELSQVKRMKDKLNVGGGFDCVVFGSVMHEISSYCEYPDERFTSIPIRRAMMDAAKILKPGGIVVVRDWLSCCKGETFFGASNFKSKDYYEWFLEFVGRNPGTKFAAGKIVDHRPMGKGLQYEFRDTLSDNCFLVTQELIMEFLMVATWGKASWERETQERRFILHRGEWELIARKAGLEVMGWMQTTEEYPRYCEKIIDMTYWTMPDTTFVMVARKPEEK